MLEILLVVLELIISLHTFRLSSRANVTEAYYYETGATALLLLGSADLMCGAVHASVCLY